MPPWRAVPGYGVFANDASLTARELQLLVAWIEGNGPKDAGQRIVANIDQLETADGDRLRLAPSRWELGTPTWVGDVRAGTVPPGRGDHVRTTMLDTGLTKPTWVTATEIRPADRRVLRAVFVRVEGTGQWLAGWTPWHGTVRLPEGTALRLPSRARLVVESHYRSAREPVEDRTQIGLYTTTPQGADGPARCVSDLRLHGEAAGAGRLRATAVLDEDARVLALTPGPGDGIQAFEVRARTPDGSTQVLLYVKDVLREWPTPYLLAAPLPLPRGTTVIATAAVTASSAAAPPAFDITISRDTAGCGDVTRSRPRPSPRR